MAVLSDIDLQRLATILTDSAYQVERAKPVDPIWIGPDPDWLESYISTVLMQVDAAVADDEKP